MQQEKLWRGVSVLALAALLAAVMVTVREVGAGEADSLPVVDSAAPFRYYAETGHNLGQPFKSFYDAHGGTAIFGLPLTEALPLSATLRSAATISTTVAPGATVTVRPPLVSGVRAATSALVSVSALLGQAAHSGVEPKVTTTPSTIVPSNQAAGATTAPQAATTLSATMALSEASELRAAAPLSATEALTPGVLVQYFERARLEYHPGTPPEAAIVVADLGRQLSQGRGEAAFLPQPQQRSILELRQEHLSELYFDQTGHTLRGSFRTFWEQHGGLPIFGYPLSEPLVERDATGAAVTVQYFERARFEYRSSGLPGVAAVQLGLVGREALARQEPLPELTAPAPPIMMLAEAATPAYSGSQDSVNIRLAAQRLDGLTVAPGETFSFLDSMGEISEQAGFVSGAGIVGGEVVPVLAGGICQVSSAVYAAAFDAGLEIVERQGHSRFLGFFAERPGVEAAVFDPGQDLRWRNDTAQPIVIATRYDKATDQVLVALWGAGDGRTVTTGAAETLEETPPEAASWTLDETLAPGELIQEEPPQDGLRVALWRSVVAASGEIMREERVVTTYAPVEEELRHGAGIRPPDADLPACLLPEVQAVGELAQALAPCSVPTPTVSVEPTAEQAPTTAPTPAHAEPLPSAQPQPTVELSP